MYLCPPHSLHSENVCRLTQSALRKAGPNLVAHFSFLFKWDSDFLPFPTPSGGVSDGKWPGTPGTFPRTAHQGGHLPAEEDSGGLSEEEGGVAPVRVFTVVVSGWPIVVIVVFVLCFPAFPTMGKPCFFTLKRGIGNLKSKCFKIV